MSGQVVRVPTGGSGEASGEGSGAASGAASGAPGGLVLSQANVPGIAHSLGVARMAPGTVSPEAVRHECGELMYVAAGQGELRMDEETIPFATGDALYIPAESWHWLANTGAEELVSVFSFPTPDRPATEHRPVAT